MSGELYGEKGREMSSAGRLCERSYGQKTQEGGKSLFFLEYVTVAARWIRETRVVRFLNVCFTA